MVQGLASGLHWISEKGREGFEKAMVPDEEKEAIRQRVEERFTGHKLDRKAAQALGMGRGYQRSSNRKGESFLDKDQALFRLEKLASAEQAKWS